MVRIKFSKLKIPLNKKFLLIVKKKEGTQSAINVAQGVLGLKRGEFGKSEKRIRAFVKGLK